MREDISRASCDYFGTIKWAPDTINRFASKLGNAV